HDRGRREAGGGPGPPSAPWAPGTGSGGVVHDVPSCRGGLGAHRCGHAASRPPGRGWGIFRPPLPESIHSGKPAISSARPPPPAPAPPAGPTAPAPAPVRPPILRRRQGGAGNRPATSGQLLVSWLPR